MVVGLCSTLLLYSTLLCELCVFLKGSRFWSFGEVRVGDVCQGTVTVHVESNGDRRWALNALSDEGGVFLEERGFGNGWMIDLVVMGFVVGERKGSRMDKGEERKKGGNNESRFLITTDAFRYNKERP